MSNMGYVKAGIYDLKCKGISRIRVFAMRIVKVEGRDILLNSRKIEDLKPYVAWQCKTLITRCKEESIDIIVIGTLRDQEYQNECFKKGTGPRLLGPHGYGLAFDVVPVVNGKAVWSNMSLWRRIAAIGKSLGLEWGGDWKRRVDCPHFQFTGGLSNAQIRAGKLPKFPPIPDIIPQKQIQIEGLNIMDYALQPIIKGMLKDTTTLICCSKPSNNAKTSSVLRKGINEPVNIYAKVKAEDIDWYLINVKIEQWVVARYVQII